MIRKADLCSLFIYRTISFFTLVLLLATQVFAQEEIKKETNISSFAKEYAALFQKGEQIRLEGDYKKALSYYERAFSVAEKTNNQEDELDSLERLGLLFWNMGRPEESSDKYRRTLEIAKELANKKKIKLCTTALMISSNYSKGKDFRSLGKYDDSIVAFKTAIELARQIDSKEHELKCLRQMSLCYWEINNFQQFFLLNNQALQIARDLNHKQEEGRCLNNIGLFYLKIDNYSEALKYYDKSLEIAKILEDLDEQANTLSNIGAIYIDIGNYDRALEFFFQALNIDKHLNDYGYISKDLNNIGNIFRRKGILSRSEEDFRAALNYYNESLSIAVRINDKNTEIKVLNNMGTIYSYINENPKALDYLHLAFRKATASKNTEEMSIILTNIGIVYAQMGDYEESTKYYQKAIDLALEIKDGRILWEAYLEIANAYKNQNKLDAATENYKKSISVIENTRSSINLEEYRATFFGTDKRIEAYQNIIDSFIRKYKRDRDLKYEVDAFYYFEKAKARAFLDSLEVSKVDLTQGISQKFRSREAELMNEISEFYTKLLTPQLTAEQRVELDAKLEEREEQLESLKREIREASPAYANLRYPKNISLSEAQSELLDKETACLAYLLAKENSYAFVITRKDIKIFPLPERQEIQKLVQEYLQSITDVENNDFHLGYELYNILVRPGLNDKIKKIIIVPDDALYFLPFETLLTQKKGSDWLIKSYNIAYVPSLSSLRELIDRRSESKQTPKKDFLAFGDPSFGANEIDPLSASGKNMPPNDNSSANPQFYRLKYSGLETEKIAALFKPGRREVFERDQASEEVLKKQDLADFKIIHFATHAIIDDKKPARSAIVLALDQDPGEDGLLQMREVFNLKLNAELVTLSACQTGLGQLIRGEGIEGLSRAFFYAGASSVLLSVWAINDQASYQLLERFYFHLRSSDTIMDALRKAKLDLIDSGVLSHPYYWGGFIVTGEADRIVFPRRMNKWIIVTLSLCAGLAILILIMNYDKTALLFFKN
jgi:CHAT domain-containing protein/Tfp pilus assembly protein PilF